MGHFCSIILINGLKVTEMGWLSASFEFRIRNIWIVKSSCVHFNLQGAIRRSEAIMAQLRQTVLLIASAFLVLQLTELVSAATGKASFYTAPFVRKFLPFKAITVAVRSVAGS